MGVYRWYYDDCSQWLWKVMKIINREKYLCCIELTMDDNTRYELRPMSIPKVDQHTECESCWKKDIRWSFLHMENTRHWYAIVQCTNADSAAQHMIYHGCLSYSTAMSDWNCSESERRVHCKVYCSWDELWWFGEVWFVCTVQICKHRNKLVALRVYFTSSWRHDSICHFKHYMNHYCMIKPWLGLWLWQIEVKQENLDAFLCVYDVAYICGMIIVVCIIVFGKFVFFIRMRCVLFVEFYGKVAYEKLGSRI